jgi:hypothetical protein
MAPLRELDDMTQNDDDSTGLTDAPARINRRRLIATAGITTGALWVAPSMLSFSAAAAASALAAVTAGTAVHIQGNNNATVPLPTGTFTQYLLIVAEVTTASGNTGFLPLLTPGSGFTLITSDSAAPPPNFAVYKSATGTIDPALTGNDTKGRWTAVVLGFTTGTTVTNSPIAGSATSPITVTGVSATSNSTWVFVGSASDGVGPANWVTPSGFTKIVDIDGNNDTPPDLFVAQYNVLTTTAPATAAAFGATDSAKAILIGVG